MKFLSRDIVLDRRILSFPGHSSPSKLFTRKIPAVIVELRNNFSIERSEAFSEDVLEHRSSSFKYREKRFSSCSFVRLSSIVRLGGTRTSKNVAAQHVFTLFRDNFKSRNLIGASSRQKFRSIVHESEDRQPRQSRINAADSVKKSRR